MRFALDDRRRLILSTAAFQSSPWSLYKGEPARRSKVCIIPILLVDDEYPNYSTEIFQVLALRKG